MATSELDKVQILPDSVDVDDLNYHQSKRSSKRADSRSSHNRGKVQNRNDKLTRGGLTGRAKFRTIQPSEDMEPVAELMHASSYIRDAADVLAMFHQADDELIPPVHESHSSDFDDDPEPDTYIDTHDYLIADEDKIRFSPLCTGTPLSLALKQDLVQDAEDMAAFVTSKAPPPSKERLLALEAKCEDYKMQIAESERKYQQLLRNLQVGASSSRSGPVKRGSPEKRTSSVSVNLYEPLMQKTDSPSSSARKLRRSPRQKSSLTSSSATGLVSIPLSSPQTKKRKTRTTSTQTTASLSLALAQVESLTDERDVLRGQNEKLQRQLTIALGEHDPIEDDDE
eukprot:m.126256 g.126256  ORF g.126256 m.126256 type:complete len:340 (-) comp29193_c0_seq2:215-1234(-)